MDQFIPFIEALLLLRVLRETRNNNKKKKDLVQVIYSCAKIERMFKNNRVTQNSTEIAIQKIIILEYSKIILDGILALWYRKNSEFWDRVGAFDFLLDSYFEIFLIICEQKYR